MEHTHFLLPGHISSLLHFSTQAPIIAVVSGHSPNLTAIYKSYKQTINKER
jgi:hypothetical protein